MNIVRGKPPECDGKIFVSTQNNKKSPKSLPGPIYS